MRLDWPTKSHTIIFPNPEEKGKDLSNRYFWIDYSNLESKLIEKSIINVSFNIKRSGLIKSRNDILENILFSGDNLISLFILDNPGRISSIKFTHGNKSEPQTELISRLKDELKRISGNVRCVYIDPPYNTGKDWGHFNDQYLKNEWLSMMYGRLLLIHKIMADGGLIFIQIDDREHAYLDLILSEIFGIHNKIGTVIWRRRRSQANLKKSVSCIHDYILVYRKNCTDNSGDNSDGLKKFMDFINKNGWLWVNTSKYGCNQDASNEIRGYFGNKTEFNTPKPEKLLHAIIENCTDENDWVMDCFAGSGTTLAVAEKLNRKWIGMEYSPFNIGLILKRLATLHDLVNGSVGSIRDINGPIISVSFFGDPDGKGPTPVLNMPGTEDHSSLKLVDGDSDDFVPIKNFIADLLSTLKNDVRKFNTVKSAIILSPFLKDVKNKDSDGKIGHKAKDSFSNLFKNVLNIDSQKLSLVEGLAEDGFISVFCTERVYSYVKILLDLFLGKRNYVSTFIWKYNVEYSGKILKRNCIAYILLYAKNMEKMKFYKLPPSDKLYYNPDNDPRGPWLSHPLVASEKSDNKSYMYTFKDGRTITRKWRYAYETIKRLELENRIHYTHPKNGVGIPRVKKFFFERMEEFNKTGKHGRTPNTLLIDSKEFGNLDLNNWLFSSDPPIFLGFNESNSKANAMDPHRSGYDKPIPSVIDFIIRITTNRKANNAIL